MKVLHDHDVDLELLGENWGLRPWGHTRSARARSPDDPRNVAARYEPAERRIVPRFPASMKCGTSRCRIGLSVAQLNLLLNERQCRNQATPFVLNPASVSGVP